MGEPSIILQIKNLEIRYGFRTAVEELSLELSRGNCLGLLGVNGAGKTSTIRAALGMLKPHRGEIQVFGGRPGTSLAFKRIGFAPEDGVPPEYLSAEEYLYFVARLKAGPETPKAEVSRLLDLFELPADKRIREFSKGMKRRVVLAQAFLGEPEMLILDEPLNGLDPLIIIKLRDLIDEHLRRGASIIYSSHILTEVEKSCTAIAILKAGRLIFSASIPETVAQFGSVEAAFAKTAGGGTA